jgi:hypothetical protein
LFRYLSLFFFFLSVTVFIFYIIKGRALWIGLRECYVYYLDWLGLTRFAGPRKKDRDIQLYTMGVGFLFCFFFLLSRWT